MKFSRPSLSRHRDAGESVQSGKMSFFGLIGALFPCLMLALSGSAPAIDMTPTPLPENRIEAPKMIFVDKLQTERVQAGSTGTSSGQPDEDAAAMAMATTTEANNSFAVNLYKQLARENAGKNLFFSPYSVSSALAMTIEGACGETATEMGNVLQYPESVRQETDSTRPWRTSVIHAGFHQLNQALHSDPDDPEAAAIRNKIDHLRDKLAEAKAATKATKAARDWGKFGELAEAEAKIADEINTLSVQVDQFEISVANALWAEKTYRIEKPYLATIAKYYGTGAVQPADFKHNFETERLRINDWVEEKTKERIRNLIPAGALDKLTRLVLVNAIYFKGNWSMPFDEKNTKELDFYLTDGDVTRAQTMQASNLEGGGYGAFQANGEFFKTPETVSPEEEIATYPDRDGFAIAELPYKGNELSMVLIAPLAHNGLDMIERQLSTENLNTWLARLEERKMHVKLPKFKLETDYVLGDSEAPKALQEMGMARAFTDPRRSDGADFTGIHDTDILQDRLYIGKVLHKAFLDVNEKGTEAAAATAVAMMQTTSFPMTQPFTPTFSADRPFFLMIRHHDSGSILFMGRIVNPLAK